MDISFLHLSFIISMNCICMSHCTIIHLHLACFGSTNYIHSIFIVRMLCSLMHDPCIFLCKKNKKKRTERKSQWSLKVYTAFLVTCIGYHDDSYKQTMLGLYTHFSWKMIENHVNMVPNALLIRKMVVLWASHVDLIFTFVMHSISVP